MHMHKMCTLSKHAGILSFLFSLHSFLLAAVSGLDLLSTKEIVPVKAVDREVYGLSRETRMLFLERQIVF